MPTVVLTLISQLTNYWGAAGQLFEAVIGVNATVIMTLAAIFISYFQSLPASATIRYTSILNNKHIQYI
jgi:hypothetical protein